MVDPLAEEMVAAIASTVDWWRPCDRPAVFAWARVEARVQLLTEWLADKGGDIDEEDETVRPAAELLTRLEKSAESMRSRLGRDVAASQVDLARLWAEDAGTDDDPPDAQIDRETATERPETDA